MDNLLDQVLLNLQIEKINLLQEKSYTAIRANSDVMVISPTGSGKTLAFLLPLFSLMKRNISSVQSIVIVPSRELALQIESVWRKMSTDFKCIVCYGGHDIKIEIKNFSSEPALIIATPGRLLDHIERGSFDPSSVKYLILDEFDKSLELGFQDQMSEVLASFSRLEKRILTSATSDIKLPGFIELKNFVSINMSKSDNQPIKLSSYIVFSDSKDKIDKLFQLICSLKSEAAMIFCNHRDAAERISDMLKAKGIHISFYHGGLEQIERERVLMQFRNGSLNYLVTTDLGARGLDLPDVRHIIHYHLPSKESEFIHRNGRTARMGASGNIYLLLYKGEEVPEYISDIFKVLKITDANPLPKKPEFVTIYVSGGRKNKLSKGDIVGFFFQKGELSRDDLGLIEVKDFASFVAVRSDKAKPLLKKLKDLKLKGKKYKIEIAQAV